MASSNRHWPSMFKSKPCNTHHQWQHDINHQSLISTGCHRSTPFTSVGGCEERSPEPKPRWNPKPEQIRILEAIFNSGMVNPPRDEIRKIRAQLQEYGQVGDANVFYWFQNRKSRSKHKLRHQLQTSKSQQQQNPNPNNAKTPPPPNPAPSSSSSSSEKSSPKEKSAFSSIGFAVEANNNLIASPQQSFFQTSSGISTTAHELQAQHHFFGEPFFFPLQYSSPPSSSPPVTLVGPQSLVPQHHDLIMMAPNHHHHHHDQHQVAVQNNNIGPCTSLLLSEIMSHHGGSKKDHHDNNDHHRQVIEKDLLELNYSLSTTTTTTVATGSPATIAPARSGGTRANVSEAPITPVINHVQGVGGEGAVVGSSGGGGAAKSTVFINDVAFEVPVGPFNVREAFGDEAVLINSYGQPVLTNEWGLTLHSLHHGAFYYLI